MNNGTYPKFIHYAAHAETLAQFFDGFGLHKLGRSFPSSALIIEFVTINKQLAVRFVYYDGETQKESVVQWSSDQTKNFITLGDFVSKISTRVSMITNGEASYNLT